jgi:3',5'-cyclic AMP phosphodiesterase CpdA
VAEIRSLSPPPDLVLFAGDLAHRGRPDALDLGQEILADLPAPCWAVRGEGDRGPGGNSAWVRRWGDPWFSRSQRGCQVIGLDTVWRRTPRGPVFEIGAPQRRWLARELTLLSPSTPLVILSHAPLGRIFHPWQQWTGDAPEVAQLLGQFSQALCLHGHVHGAGIWEAGIRDQGSGAEYFETNPPDYCRTAFLSLLTQNPKPGTQNHVSLPATAWPRPLAVQGTPATPRPGLGPRGCGWGLISMRDRAWHIVPNLWRT